MTASVYLSSSCEPIGKQVAPSPWTCPSFLRCVITLAPLPVLSYSAASIGSSVSHLYPDLLAAGLDVLMLSGNDDGYVPSLGTRSWLGSLKQLTVVQRRQVEMAGERGGDEALERRRPEEAAGSREPLADQQPWVDQETGQVMPLSTTISSRALSLAASLT